MAVSVLNPEIVLKCQETDDSFLISVKSLRTRLLQQICQSRETGKAVKTYLGPSKNVKMLTKGLFLSCKSSTEAA